MRYEPTMDWDESRAVHPMLRNGVKDTKDGAWVVRGLRSEDADWHAAVLSARYTEEGDRPDGQVSWRLPPRPVILWRTATRSERALLHVWVREPGGWQGWVSYVEREKGAGGRWAPQQALRPDQER